MIRTATVAALALLAATSPAQAASVFAFAEAPGMQYGTVNFTYGGVEEFDSVRGYQPSIQTDFYGSDIHATISNFTGSAANQFGGAFGTGGFATAAGAAMTVSLTSGPVVNYLGLWVSALDGANSIAFFSRGVQLASFNLVEQIAGLNNPAYRGNPNAAFRGQNGGEAYAFVNFISDTSFDRVDLTQNGGGGFELDNLTVGFAGANAVPEPATWGTMLLGFGLVGSAARRRRAGRALPAVC